MRHLIIIVGQKEIMILVNRDRATHTLHISPLYQQQAEQQNTDTYKSRITSALESYIILYINL